MLSSIFVAGGIDAVRCWALNESKVEAAKAVVDPLMDSVPVL